MKRKHLLVSLFVILFMIGGAMGTNQVNASENDKSDISDVSDVLVGDLSHVSESELYEAINNLSKSKRDTLSVSIITKDTITERDTQILSIINQVESEHDESNPHRILLISIIIIALISVMVA